jgi:hypothetical protein
VIAGLGEPIGADAIFLGCAFGAGLGVASLSVSYRVSPTGLNGDDGVAFPVPLLSREYHRAQTTLI